MKPLEGVRVVELASVVSGPYAGMILADQGADVIKVESPHGDISRSLEPHVAEESIYFHNFNRGKRSIVVDVRRSEGREIVLRLVSEADVVTENWRPGVAARLGLDAADLRSQFPRLITVSIRGYADDGPYAGDRVYDPIIQGVAGMAAVQGGMAHPDFVRTILPDKLSAMCATQGVLAALVARGRTGRGTHVQVSMLDAAVAFQWPDTMIGLTSPHATHATPDWDRPTPRSAAVLRAGDGKAVTYTAVSPGEWQGLCDAVDMPEWVERYPTLRHRVLYKEEISAELERLFEDLTRDEVLALLRQHDVPCGPAHGPPDVLVDPQVRHNQIIFEIDRPRIGRVREVGPLVKVGLDQWEPPRGSPALGAHTDEVLTEADYGPEDIAQLRRTGVVA